MFCAKCGTKFEDGKYICGNCGWEPAVKPAPVQQEKAPVAPAEVSAPLTESPFIQSVNAPVVQPVNAPVAQPVNAPVAQPENIPVAQPVNAPVNQPLNAPFAGQSVNPQGQPAYTPVVQPAPKPKKKKTGLIIAIVLVAVFFVFGALAALIGTVIYRSTDGYKVKEAASLVEEGDYYSADEMLMGVYTFEADAIREFINIEQAKASFVEAMSGADAASYNPEGASDEYYSFISAVDAFEYSQFYDSLPENLMSRYNAYSAANDFVTEYVYGETNDSYTTYVEECLYDYFCDVQAVMLNDVVRNDSTQFGSSFTLRELQTRVDTTNTALEKLDAYDFASIPLSGDALTYCPALWATEGSTVSISTHALGIINDLIYECENEAISNKSLIDSGLESFSWDEDLYISNADPYYTSYVGEYLQNIGSEYDMQLNADDIIIILRTEILYSLVMGETAVIS